MRFNHLQLQVPSTLINSLLDTDGFNRQTFEEVHNSGEQVTSVRLNKDKLTKTSAAEIFGENLHEGIPWNSEGYYLKQRPSFTLDPLFHAGVYYVQEASSMFLKEALSQAVDLTQPLKILDLCAAPGGKSTLIQSVISNSSLLVSNEVIKSRVNILTENTSKWGAANVIVTNNDPKDFQRLQNYFDVVVADAPCSGSGLFRKDEQAIAEWSLQNVQLCSQRQQRILADILPSLKEGGILIYSTCSYSVEEDEQIADWLIRDNGLSTIRMRLEPGWGIVETTSPVANGYGYRFYPDKLKGEGFYIAVFRKNDRQMGAKDGNAKAKSRSERLGHADSESLYPYLSHNDFFFIKQHNDVIAIPAQLEKELAVVQSCLYLKKAGVKLGALVRKQLIPDHELALSTIIAQGLPAVEADMETALQYLRRKEISTAELPIGWTLITYQQVPLGWIKVLPNRVNNYYPKDWRILNK